MSQPGRLVGFRETSSKATLREAKWLRKWG